MHVGTGKVSARSFWSICLGVLVTVLITGPVAGQIVLDQEYFEDLAGEQYDASYYEAEDPETLQDVVDATGADATYDFTAAMYDTILVGATEYYELPADLPGSDEGDFDEATHALRVSWEAQVAGPLVTDSSAWGYYQLSDEGFDFHGFIYLADVDDDAEEDTLKLTYHPALREYVLPVEYEDSWSTAARETISFFGFEIEDTVRYEYEVEGYGELVTPGGSAPALRIREVEHTSAGTDTATTTTYLNFETREGLSAVIELDDQGNPVAASYTKQDRAATAVEETDELPAGYELAQSYPNPFNPSTTIRYRIPEAGHVTLTVVNSLGQTVRELVGENRTAGTHEVTFDAAGLPSGVYLYRLRAGDYAETRTMTLVK